MFRRGFIALTAPRFLTFVVSLILALAALASLYTRLPVVGTFVNTHRVGVRACCLRDPDARRASARTVKGYAAFAFGFTSAV